jgi:uncharacterized membrane protein
METSRRSGVALLVFFVTCSWITRAGAAQKRRIEGSAHREGGSRTAVQVLSNSPSAPLLLLAAMSGNPSWLVCVFFWNCSVVSKKRDRLVLNLLRLLN